MSAEHAIVHPLLHARTVPGASSLALDVLGYE